ncbi:hypothetical protein HI914_01898 [Erysiphe necator]|uniref:ATPase inhibitor, mitochondrial n=1 Tax=Uncinula necator TaxID=52586 RepID=A0A0B1NZU7_UNCNE|nr:hypothetical protein HI914_01898 [Erysiphe necator]KHJ31508.1 putative mitochondrial atpase inhibitor [Erysiphe necator]
MQRQLISRSFKLKSSFYAALSTTARPMAAGDTGAPKSGGAQSGDAFSRREKANEDMAIKAREREKLLELRKKISEQHDHLNRLEKHLDDLANERGGYQK